MPSTGASLGRRACTRALVPDDGVRVTGMRVERLMRQADISGLISKKRRPPTIRVRGVRVCDDLVDRAFAAGAPDRVWAADIAYLRTWEGWLYIVAVQDLYSRRIVGWSMAVTCAPSSSPNALEMALEYRRPALGPI